MASLMHVPISPSYDMPDNFWAIPQSCPRQPIGFINPAVMTYSQVVSQGTATQATNNYTKTVEDIKTDVKIVNITNSSCQGASYMQEPKTEADVDKSLIEDLFDDLNAYCQNLSQKNTEEINSYKQHTSQPVQSATINKNSSTKSYHDCDPFSDISDGEEEESPCAPSTTGQTNSCSNDGYHTEEIKQHQNQDSSTHTSVYEDADADDECEAESDCESCRSDISEDDLNAGECGSNYASDQCEADEDDNNNYNDGDIHNYDDNDSYHGNKNEDNSDDEYTNEDDDDSDSDSHMSMNDILSETECNGKNSDHDSIIQEVDNEDEEEGGWVSVDEDGVNYIPGANHAAQQASACASACASNKWYDTAPRFIKSSYSNQHAVADDRTMSMSMGSHNMHRPKVAAVEDDEELELYLRCKTGFNMPMRTSYGFPRKTPEDIEEIVSLWDTDFQVGKTMVPKMGSWEQKDIHPKKNVNGAHYNRFVAWKKLYIKWVECNRSLEQWFQKYRWLGLESILLHKPQTVKTRCDDLI